MHEKWNYLVRQRERVVAAIFGCSLYFDVAFEVAKLPKFGCSSSFKRRVSPSIYLGISRLFTIL